MKFGKRFRQLVRPGTRRLKGLANTLFAEAPKMQSASAVQAYWTKHNVSSHLRFESVQDFIEYLKWRNEQYIGYLELMPVAGYDNAVILDFGCGPGHDLVGFGLYSKPRSIIGVDVSSTSLREATERLHLHGIKASLFHHDVHAGAIPIEDEFVDLVHSSGVLHHMEDPVLALREFYRILKPGGRAQIMVYNYNSIWMHLYVAYQRIALRDMSASQSLREAFTASTDGELCPISDCYKPAEFLSLAALASLPGKFRGAAVSVFEMKQLSQRWDALLDQRTPTESRSFLYNLTMNERGLPCYFGDVAGVDGCYVLQKAQAQ